MTYQMTIFKPGIVEFNRKNEPIGQPFETRTFKARSHAEGLTIAMALYDETGLGSKGHFNVHEGVFNE